MSPISERSVDASRLQPARVLLVEDDPVNAEVALALLAALGCSVEQAGDGSQALQQFQRQRFDLILMDCQMPSMDGYEATRRLRAIEAGIAISGATLRRTPVVALTAETFGSVRARCLAAGMDDHLVKPADEFLLRATLERWTGAMSARPPSVSLDNGLPSLDPQALIRNFDIGGRIRYTTAIRVIGLFLAETPRLLHTAAEGLACGDTRSLERAVHTLKSSSAVVGAAALSDVARVSEMFASAGRLAEAGATLPELAQRFSRVAPELALLRDKLLKDAAEQGTPAAAPAQKVRE